ncbi:MAG TPA: hypothetical protein VGH44_00945 [Candidatus Saccharimonadia bacterium]|jgi:hypothetical protein
MYLNFYQHQQAAQDAKLLNGQIVDLRYQVTQDHLAVTTPTPSPSVSPSDTPSPDPSLSPTPTPAGTPAVAGASTSPQSTLKQLAKLHVSPSQSSSYYGEYPAGTPVTIGTIKSGTYRQVTINGKTGYVLASYLN